MKNDGANVLWYRQGALSWNEALPLGNGWARWSTAARRTSASV